MDRAAREDGFTLIEVMVSIALIGIVMTALSTFFITTTRATHRQGDRQAAAQLADSGTDRVRALRGSAVTTGRDRTSSDTQWAAPVAGVAPYLVGMNEAWDATAGYPSGTTAALPTVPVISTVAGIGYAQHWYVGTCYQPTAGGDCVATQAPGAVRFFRAVVAVTWPDSHCSNSVCSYVTSTLVSSAATEPVFNPGQSAQPPAVSNPGTQTGELTVAANLQLTASGGAAPLTWSASGLPAGLTISSGGQITGTPTTVGSNTVVATVTDAFGLTGRATFTWTVNARPALTSPGAQSSPTGTPVSLTVARTGGTAAFSWTATNLPTGLSIDAASGVISGTPTTVRAAANVTVTVTDTYRVTSSVTFTWAVIANMTLQTPANQTDQARRGIGALQIVRSGGTSPFTWSATGLPAGLSINASGRITGTPNTAGTYTVVVSVRDRNGLTASTAPFTWTIT